MLKENIDVAELAVTTFFKIEELKKVLLIENNIDLVDFLESYRHLYHMLNVAMNENNRDLSVEKMEQTTNYIKKLLDFSEQSECKACNVNEATRMLKDVHQRLQLLNTLLNSENVHQQTGEKISESLHHEFGE